MSPFCSQMQNDAPSTSVTTPPECAQDWGADSRLNGVAILNTLRLRGWSDEATLRLVRVAGRCSPAAALL